MSFEDFTATLAPTQAMRFDGTVKSATAITRWANAFPVVTEDEPNASFIMHDNDPNTDDLLIAVGDENVPVPVGAWIIVTQSGFLVLQEPAPAAPDLVETPGNTLADSVRYLLANSPHTVRDLSGDRTGTRGQEDLIGSLSITFTSMQAKLANQVAGGHGQGSGG